MTDDDYTGRIETDEEVTLSRAYQLAWQAWSELYNSLFLADDEPNAEIRKVKIEMQIRREHADIYNTMFDARVALEEFNEYCMGIVGRAHDETLGFYRNRIKVEIQKED